MQKYLRTDTRRRTFKSRTAVAPRVSLLLRIDNRFYFYIKTTVKGGVRRTICRTSAEDNKLVAAGPHVDRTTLETCVAAP